MTKLAKTLMKTLTRITAFALLALSGVYFLRINSPYALRMNSASRLGLFLPKILAGSLAPFIVLAGAVSGLLAFLLRMPATGAMAGLATLLAGRYTRRASAAHEGFDRAFGPGWEQKIPPDVAARLPHSRWQFRLPDTPDPRFSQDVVFWTVPGPAGAQRQLLCDIWQPPAGTEPSGLAFIYLHNSFWHFLDKDVGTRPFFRHLAGQGHVVMDVAYRLCPEVGIREMVGDARRAIAWMKAHAAEYGVHPERVVVAGASAGGHLAQLAAYAPDLPELAPADLGDAQMSVRAVVSYYGPTDMRVWNEYAGPVFGEGYLFGKPSKEEHEEMGVSKDHLTTNLTHPKKSKAWSEYFYPITFRQIMKNLLGGQPDEVPHMYDLASPVEHVGAHCPPTLFLQGEHDDFVKATAVRAMADSLREAGVPAVYVEFPQTEHAFDLFLPRYSPATQAALYDLDRFLGLMAFKAGEPAHRERPPGSLQPHAASLE